MEFGLGKLKDYCRMAGLGVEAARARSWEAYHGYGRSRLRGLGVEYVDFRDYSIGDDYKRIDWRITARTPGPEGYRLIVKEYEEEHIHDVTMAV